MSDRPPDPPEADDRLLLASAFLDGELTHAERHAAQADPDVMALVAELRALQEAVDDVPPPDPVVRARAIAAAMAEFSGGARASSAVAGTGRSRWSRSLTVAAAAVAVVAAGAVATRSLGGNQSDDSTAGDADVALVAPADAPAPGAVAADTRDAADGDVSDLSDDGESTYSAAPATDAEESVMSEMSYGSTPIGDDTGGAEPPTAPDAALPVITDPDTVVSSPAELTGLGVYLTEQSAAGTLRPSPDTRCSFTQAARLSAATMSESALDRADAVDIVAEGTYLLDGAETTVLVGVDRETLRTFVLDPDTCTVLVEGLAP